MARAHLYRSISDSNGNIRPAVQVSVFNAGSTQLTEQTLYTGETGSTALENPFVSSDGVIDFYLDRAQSVKIELRDGSSLSTFDNIEVVPSPDNVVQAANGFAIQNAPEAGQFLQSWSQTEAQWVDADDLVATKASPLNTLASYEFSLENLGNLVITDTTGATITPSFVDVEGTLPGDYDFVKAIRVPVVRTVSLRIPVLTFPEQGTIIFVYKIVSEEQGVGGAMLRATIDGGARRIETSTDPNLINTWVVGYLGGITPGTHSLQIDHIPGSDPDSYVLLGHILVQYGNNIPYHTHQGQGADSVVLGPDASAKFARSSAAGGEATAAGNDATAFGYRANAQARAVAFGPYSHAAPNGVTLGYYATNLDGTDGGVAIGRNAHTGGDNAVSIGIDSEASGERSVALGFDAQAAGDEALALGSEAQAEGERSVALGRGADAGHARSMALGPGAVTTEDDQIVLGTAETTVEISGVLQALGASTILGAADSVLGFFGAAGTARPVVTGSREGNAVLTDLLTKLDALGLIDDQSTA